MEQGSKKYMSIALEGSGEKYLDEVQDDKNYPYEPSEDSREEDRDPFQYYDADMENRFENRVRI